MSQIGNLRSFEKNNHAIYIVTKNITPKNSASLIANVFKPVDINGKISFENTLGNINRRNKTRNGVATTLMATKMSHPPMPLRFFIVTSLHLQPQSIRSDKQGELSHINYGTKKPRHKESLTGK